MEQAARKAWLGQLAQAPAQRLLGLWQDAGLEQDFHMLRAPETGTVMVRGRMGGRGAAFNLGELTVTRCSVALEDGTVGHGYVQGRSRGAARVAALADALLQTARAPEVRARILEPLAAKAEAADARRASQAAATRVDFFTLARGEDP